MTVSKCAGLTALVFCASSCFSGELDPELGGVFVCEATPDCALGLSCENGVCVASDPEAGPELLIESPLQLDIFAQDAIAGLPLRISGTDLPTSAQDAGYVEIQLDGALVDTVELAELEAGVDVTSIPLPGVAGLHHVNIIARRPDGAAFDNAGAEDHIGFWVDDGAEHIGILTPAPGARIPLGQGTELSIEIASLNFTFVNPGFVDPGEAGDRIGYANLYIDADVPGCLPACNFDYQTSILPAGLSRVNRIISDQGVLLRDSVGATRLQIVAQTTANDPYHRTATDDSIVYHQVPVQSIVAGTP